MTRRITHKTMRSVGTRLDDRRDPQRPRTLAAAANVAKKTAARKTSGPNAAATKTPARAKVNKVDAAGTEHLRQLAAAEARIKELEARLANVTDRIAWVVDRLHSVLDENG